ncbi:heavy metal translocating P-type ATPase [Anaerotignum sp.]|uniref:heavy metal translocating P-type ATPase n=1 Tax=Anaerotignum sp. TaxID=2039241 RepID=UPI002A91626D|nr:heavy metal translocating P-type ATPase [Anaerotignum sp.]MCI7657161.1 heavy metal translocating P-type ATPase [Clostridia bacterium]MDY5415561.1 heavy metal translocating P-type ATPase [Anaerotignum sp.]
MRYAICYDGPGRLRLRLGQYAFSEEEGWGIASLLRQKAGVERVRTCAQNGSILIYYGKEIAKETLLDAVGKLRRADIPQVEPTGEEEVQAIDLRFQEKICGMVLRRAAEKLLLPVPLQICKTCLRAVPFLWHGLHSLLHGRINVHVLDAAAIGASMLKRSFSSASSIMFLLSFSDILEDYTRKRTETALSASLAIQIDKVWLVTPEGDVQIPLSDVKAGDWLRIRTGTMIPIDGKVREGEAMVNEATMTGEPLAVRKAEGAMVYAGTLVEEGSVAVEVMAVNAQTRIQRIMDLIAASEELKANVQGKAERLADRIVPYHLLTAAAVFLLTRNTTKTMAILTVDYSCAIKLATPIAVISAMREAANHRMMVKGGRHLEAFGAADTIIFDKTGTLTEACPQVSQVIAFGDYERDEVLRTAACLEEHFPHSVARAIVRQAAEEGLFHEERHAEVKYVVAHGIASELEGEKVIIGSPHFVFEDEGISLKEADKEKLDTVDSTDSAVYLAIGEELAGAIFIHDPVRQEAAEVMEALRQTGIQHIIMMTGDGEKAARNACQQLGITEYYARVLPEDKAAKVEEIKAQGRTVIMVGDGINDSPALSAANVSVAMKDASDLAREVADIALLSGELWELVTLRHLSQALMGRISRNYKAIIGFNTSLLLLGLAGILQPTVSAFFHNLSTVAISGTSMRPLLPKEKEEQTA